MTMMIVMMMLISQASSLPSGLGPPADAVRKVAEGSAFKSREVARPEPAKQEEAPKRRERRIYRTGRVRIFRARPSLRRSMSSTASAAPRLRARP